MGHALSRDRLKVVKNDFKKFDLDSDKQITRAELFSVMQKSDPCWTEDLVNKLFNAIDVDRNGTLTLDEVIDWVFANEKVSFKDASETWVEKQFEKLPFKFAHMLWKMSYDAGMWGLSFLGDGQPDKFKVEEWPQFLAKQKVLSQGVCAQFTEMACSIALAVLEEVFSANLPRRSASELKEGFPVRTGIEFRLEKVREAAVPVPHEVSEELWNKIQDMAWAAIRTGILGRKAAAKRAALLEQDGLSKNTRLFGEAAAAMVKEELSVQKFGDMLLEWQLGYVVSRKARVPKPKQTANGTSKNVKPVAGG